MCREEGVAPLLLSVTSDAASHRLASGRSRPGGLHRTRAEAADRYTLSAAGAGDRVCVGPDHVVDDYIVRGAHCIPSLHGHAVAPCARLLPWACQTTITQSRPP